MIKNNLIIFGRTVQEYHFSFYRLVLIFLNYQIDCISQLPSYITLSIVSKPLLEFLLEKVNFGCFESLEGLLEGEGD